MSQRSDLVATLVQVAHLYYEENKSQQEIAEQLGVSRSLIALHLKRAREENIVRIEIVNPQDECEDLALLLREKTGLRRVYVVPAASNQELTRRSLGGAVARFLENQLQDGAFVGLGWGRTIMEVVNLLAPAKRRLIEVIPLLGESSHTWSYTQMNQIVLQMAKSFGGRPHFLLVPLMVGSKAMRDDLMNDEVARQVVERWDRLDVACVGIGALPPTEGQVLYMGEENVSCFLEKGAVGDICARYYDIHGKHIESEMYDRLIGITPEQLKKIKVLIAVAAGIDKMRAVVGALHSSLVTDLYLDEELAKAIVSELR